MAAGNVLEENKWKWKSLSYVWLFATPWTVHGILQTRIPFPSPRHLPNPGIKPRSPSLQADSLQVEPQGKPKNTGVGSLTLLQRIFLTQELNWGLLHCRSILYQLSYHGTLTENKAYLKWFYQWFHNVLLVQLCQWGLTVPLPCITPVCPSSITICMH